MESFALLITVSGLIGAALALWALFTLREISRQTQRTALAAEKTAAWVQWMAEQQKGGH